MFRGSFVALATPFNTNHEIDFEAYGRLIDRQIEQGTQGLVPCGCTGEAATLDHDEQEECIRFTIERAAGRVSVIAGTGSNNTQEALRLTVAAKKAGADGALLITPYYNKPVPAGQIAHYRTIAEEVDIPIVLYNVPGRTGTNMQPDTVAELSEIENIVAIKESSGGVDQAAQIMSLSDITVLSGDDYLTMPMMALGGQGVVSVAANVVPKHVAHLVDACLNNQMEKARELHYELLPLFKGLFIETNPIPLKSVLARMGLCEDVVRLPLTPLPAEKYDKLDPILKGLGLV